MRIHRYASDLPVVVMVIHLVREFSSTAIVERWFTWVTGIRFGRWSSPPDHRVTG